MARSSTILDSRFIPMEVSTLTIYQFTFSLSLTHSRGMKSCVLAGKGLPWFQQGPGHAVPGLTRFISISFGLSRWSWLMLRLVSPDACITLPGEDSVFVLPQIFCARVVDIATCSTARHWQCDVQVGRGGILPYLDFRYQIIVTNMINTLDTRVSSFKHQLHWNQK